jgi:hypothetical protein
MIHLENEGRFDSDPRVRSFSLVNAGISTGKWPAVSKNFSKCADSTERRHSIYHCHSQSVRCQLDHYQEYAGIIRRIVGYSPFTEPSLGSRKCNETRRVAFALLQDPVTLGEKIQQATTGIQEKPLGVCC